ncbi:ATP-binding protein [Elusimicrobiota bacterium]
MKKTAIKKILYDRLHEKLFGQAPLGIAVVDRKYNVVEANKEFTKTYGSWRNRKCYEVYKGKRHHCQACPATKTFKDGKTRVSEESGEDRRGNIRHYVNHFFPFKDSRGKIPYIVEMATDITDRVNIEKELRLIFDNAPCYISVINRKLQVIEANKLFYEKFGKRGAKYCHQMYKRSNKPCLDCPAKETFKTGKAHRSLQAGIDKKGNKSHYVVTAAPLDTAKGRRDRVIEIALDVSELLNLKERLKKSEKARIENARLAAVGQTVAGLAHGIKNVIMGLEGGMYVVNSGFKNEDRELVKKGWGMLENNISKVSAFIKEFLNFARGTGLNTRMVDPAAIAKEVAALFKLGAKSSGVELVCDYSNFMENVQMDPKGIHTCLANLVSNAIDACLVSDNKDLRVTLSCYEKDGSVYYEVRDNGCGMDYEIKKKVFTSFFTTKGSGQGTGIGLLQARKIVNQHGGAINVESSVGKGSAFKLEFPKNRLLEMSKISDTRIKHE